MIAEASLQRTIFKSAKIIWILALSVPEKQASSTYSAGHVSNCEH
jgi:hypothetical protein